jgi:hypothetical protein
MPEATPAHTISGSIAITAPLPQPRPGRARPSVLEMGRQHRALADRYRELDEQRVKLKPNTRGSHACALAMDGLYAERVALEKQILARDAETLADAAVLAVHGFVMAERVAASNLGCNQDLIHERLKQMQHAFASILMAFAKSGYVRLEEIGWPDTAHLLDLRTVEA